MQKKSAGRLNICAIVAWFAFAVSPGYAGELPGVLERPALSSARAAHSMLLGITRAGSRLVAVGERGIILLSDDGGVVWRQAKVPVSVSLVAARFATPLEGWAVGHLGVVLHTSDGGETWNKQLDGIQAAQLIYQAARSRAKGGEGDESKLGQELSAAQRLIDDGPDKPFLDLWPTNDRVVTVVGSYNLVFRTDDGGQSWKPLDNQIDNPQSLHLYGIRSIGARTYVAGEQGGFYRSLAPNSDFETVGTPYDGTYFGVVALSSGELILFGLRGHAYWTGDQGGTWQKIETHIANSLVAGLELAGGTIVLVSQVGDVLLSGDRGRTFGLVASTRAIPTADAAQAPDGALVVVGAGGARRIVLAAPSEKAQPR